MLLNHGLELNGATDADGKNIFHHLAGSWRASATDRLTRTFEILQSHLRKKEDDKCEAGDLLMAKTVTEGQTALHLVCSAGTTDIATMLLKESGGACVTERDASGATPVVLLLRHRFKAKKQMELLKKLI